MPTLEQLEHKLRLVEASRKRLQSAPWSTYSRSDTSREVMSHLAAQLGEAEDELAQLKAKYEIMQRSTSAELAELRGKCDNLEDNTGIDNLMTKHPAVASEIKKAYVTGKVEVQRTLRQTEKEMDSLRSALQDAQENAETTRGQVSELKKKYEGALQQKSSLHKHTQVLQERIHDLQAEQVECVSHTIRNTQRAQQMSERVLQSLAQAQRKHTVRFADDGQVATLTVENAILHEMLQSGIPQMDPASQCLVSTLTDTLRKSSQRSSAVAPPAAPSQPQVLHGSHSAGLKCQGSEGQDGHNTAGSCGAAGAQQPCSSAACEQEAGMGGETDLLGTLLHVLRDCDMPESTPEQPGAADDADDAASDSDWSGDEVMQAASQTLRTPAGCTHSGVGTVQFDTTGVSELSGMEVSQAVQGASAPPCKMTGTVRRRRKGPKTRRDTMELSRVPRLAAQLRAPMHANSAVSFLQKLAKARRDGGLEEQLPGEDGMLFAGGTEQEGGQMCKQRVEADHGISDDTRMEQARAVISAAVRRRKRGQAEAAAKDEANTCTAEAGHAKTVPDALATDAIEPQPHTAGTWQNSGVPAVGAVVQPEPNAEASTASATAPEELFCAQAGNPASDLQAGRDLPMRMPNVHATSMAVAQALRRIGSAKGTSQIAEGQPTAAMRCALGLQSVGQSPRQRPTWQGAHEPRIKKPWLVSATSRRGSVSPVRSRSLSPPQRLPESCASPNHSNTIIAELQAQTHTMASIMNEHMPWMISEVTRATRTQADKTLNPCHCSPPLSIPAMAQAADKHGAIPAHKVPDAVAGVSMRSVPPASSKRHLVKEAGEKYAATLTKSREWRCSSTASHARARGGVTMHPPASHGLRFQQSLLRDSTA